MINKVPDNKENFDVMEQSCCMSLSVNSVSKLLSTFQSPSNCPLVKTLFVYVVRESKWQIYSFHAQINRPVPKVHPEHESHVTHRSHPPPRCLEFPTLSVLETHFHCAFWGLVVSPGDGPKSLKSLMWIFEASYLEL